MKVVHVVESLAHGAVENWLLRMLRHGLGRGIALDWTFYCTLGAPGVLDGEARSLGARVVHSPAPLREKLRFIGGLRAALRAGRYDVLHCHHDLLSAVYLLAGVAMPIRRRIVHVHNADEGLPTPARLKRRVLREPMRRTCLAMADRIVGISAHTLDTFLAGRPRRAGRDLVHYYGMDPAPFETPDDDRASFRRRHDLAGDALIVLFAGRVVPEKNPAFVIDVLAELRRREPRAVAVFAGVGAQESEVLARARRHGVEGAVRMLGWRDDLADVMRCSDWFVLPRPEQPMEGFGMAVVEAQLAGLRMLLSRGIADDPLLPTACYRRIALAAGAAAWADAALELLRGPRPSRAAALDALKHSPMQMDRALDALLALHQ